MILQSVLPKNNLPQAQQNGSKTVKQWPVRFQAELFKLLSDLLTVGFSVNHAVQFCAGLFTKYRTNLELINQLLRGGAKISEAFEPFVDDQIGMQLKLAEQHGQLSESLGHISRLLTANNRRREKIQRLLQYPIILGISLILIIVGLNVLVLPQINQLTGNRPKPLNWLFWGLLVLILVGCLGLIGHQIKRLALLPRVEKLARLPLIGTVIKAYYGYYLLASLAIMAAGGLGTQEMLKTVEQAKPTTLLYQFGTAVSKRLKAGTTLGVILHDYAFVPDELEVLIETGKPQAEIVQELAALSELYYQRLTTKFESLMTWIQPLAFLILGCVIVGSYVSLFLPMYSSIGGMG